MQLTKQELAAASLRIDGLTKYDGECMTWIGYISDRERRARLTIAREGRRFSADARLTRWTFVHGAPKQGMVVRMTCGNRLCMNVAHMRLGTMREVLRDVSSRHKAVWNISKTLANRKSRGKLTIEIARAIRSSDESNLALSKKYGVSSQRIWQIRRGLAWPDFALMGVAA